MFGGYAHEIKPAGTSSSRTVRIAMFFTGVLYSALA
jgi:hypothetical protein